MMERRTLTKLEKQQYEEIKQLFQNQNIIMLEESDYIRLRDILCFLISLGYLRKANFDGGWVFAKQGNFEDFEKWHKDKEQEANKLSRREWRIAIVSAAIGAFIGLLPTIIPWLIQMIAANG